MSKCQFDCVLNSMALLVEEQNERIVTIFVVYSVNARIAPKQHKPNFEYLHSIVFHSLFKTFNNNRHFSRRYRYTGVGTDMLQLRGALAGCRHALHSVRQGLVQRKAQKSFSFLARSVKIRRQSRLGVCQTSTRTADGLSPK